MAGNLSPEQMGELEVHFQAVLEAMNDVQSSLEVLAGNNDEAAADIKDAFVSIVETLEPWIETLEELSDG